MSEANQAQAVLVVDDTPENIDLLRGMAMKYAAS
jgi:CheY-like chemotaxis protein